MSRISRLNRSEVTTEMAALYDRAFAQRGNVPNMFRVMAHRPEIFATMQAHFAAVLNTGTVSTKLKELIIVRTSQVNATPYCLASHTILAKGLGWTDDQLAHLADWPRRDDFTPAEKAALRLAETVTRDAHAVADEQFAELRSFYSEGEIVELLCAIGLFNYFNPVSYTHLGERITTAEIDALRQRHANFNARMDELFTAHQLLLLPAAPVTRLAAGADHSQTRVRLLRYTTPFSLAGVPVVTIPSTAGGMQLAASREMDEALLQLAARIGARRKTAAHTPPA